MSSIQDPQSGPDNLAAVPSPELSTTSSIEDLQTADQRRVLDTVDQVRKCGLDSIVVLPQLVVCGDQSAGKSSVLEALTEIPFPRNDNLCTRFATEIILRRANVNSLTIKVIPDAQRSANEKSMIFNFTESITDFNELPRIMEKAMEVMGIAGAASSDEKPRAFARDVLSIVIEGPHRPQLTLVDIPGLIATSSRGVTKADVDLVAEITHQYVSQHRTICLAVVAATNDYANQKILEKVRAVDPEGDRTLGIITKPDGLAANSGAEKAFIDLAKNEDIFFKLGWHVLKNRKFEEREFSLTERNLSETMFFRKSNFKCLPAECVGIDELRRRLSILLFEHVKRELPKLRQDLESALHDSREQLDQLGYSRSSALECKKYLAQLSHQYQDICKAAVHGHYEGPYFRTGRNKFSLDSPLSLRRSRAVVQHLNTIFAANIGTKGAKYKIDMDDTSPVRNDRVLGDETMNRAEALDWVREILVSTRGKELVGNFNPLLIGELFWEQSSNWHTLAHAHVERVSDVCGRFLKNLLRDKCPQDVEPRIWSSIIEDALSQRKANAIDELKKLIQDLQSHPINYNHYYTETIAAGRREKQKAALADYIAHASIMDSDEEGDDGDDDDDEPDLSEVRPDSDSEKDYGFNPAFGSIDDAESPPTTHKMNGRRSVARIDVDQVVSSYWDTIDPNMENYSCEEALRCLFAIYKVCPSPSQPQYQQLSPY